MTTFEYRRGRDRRRRTRPFALVSLSYRHHRERDWMLIDSGAEVSVISRVTGALLGMSRRPDEEAKYIRGAGGGRVPVLYRQVRLTIGDHTVQARVGWIQDGTPLSILGPARCLPPLQHRVPRVRRGHGVPACE